ncbi:MAG: germination lipoprotein GerS [Peptostreptococcaceae bacterium]
MRNKWMTLLIVTICVFSSLVGCQKKEYTKEEVYQKFQEQVSKVQSYTCTAEIEVVGNKGNSSYTLIHTYNKPDNYKIEVLSPEHLKGKTMEYKDDKIIIKNPEINDSIELPNKGKNEQYLFVGDFIKNYLENEDMVMNFSDNQLVLEANIPGDDKYFNKQILYVSTEKQIPEKMEIIDQEGNIRFTVKYKNFEYKK